MPAWVEVYKIEIIIGWLRRMRMGIIMRIRYNFSLAWLLFKGFNFLKIFFITGLSLVVVLISSSIMSGLGGGVKATPEFVCLFHW